MNESYFAMLDSFLADPHDPRWSSDALARMYASADAPAKQTLLATLQRIDDRFARCGRSLSEPQTNFIRSVTLFAYTSRISPDLHVDDIGWLISRFSSHPIPHRALMVTLLFRVEELPGNIGSLIVEALTGTPGERFLDSHYSTDSSTT